MNNYTTHLLTFLQKNTVSGVKNVEIPRSIEYILEFIEDIDTWSFHTKIYQKWLDIFGPYATLYIIWNILSNDLHGKVELSEEENKLWNTFVLQSKFKVKLLILTQTASIDVKFR